MLWATTTAATADQLSVILLDLGGADEAAARQEAELQAPYAPLFKSVGLETITFEGVFIPASNDTKLAVFSDDGVDVFVDDVKVHSRFEQPQHLPELEQSFHVLSASFEQGQACTIRVVYSNIQYDGDCDLDGLTLFGFGGGGAPLTVEDVVLDPAAIAAQQGQTSNARQKSRRQAGH